MKDGEKAKGNTAEAGKEPFNPAFDKRLMRRRWSEKEIVNVIANELDRNGKLTQKLRAMIGAGNDPK